MTTSEHDKHVSQFLAHAMTSFSIAIRIYKIDPLEAASSFLFLLSNAIECGLIREASCYTEEQKARLPFFTDGNDTFFFAQGLFFRDTIGETKGRA